MPVSLVVPCYNERDSLFYLAERLSEMQSDFDGRYDFQLIFVDDGSSDDTYELLHEHFAQWNNALILQHPENRGLTAAILTGARHADHEIVCSIDSDCTYDPVILAELIPLIQDDVVLATASPYHPEGVVKNVPRWRIWLSYMASVAYRQIFRNRLYCYTCCVRAYRRSALSQVEIQESGFVGTTELLWRLENCGWRFAESPATLDVRKFGQSKMRTLQVMYLHARMLLVMAGQRFLGLSPSPEFGVAKAKNANTKQDNMPQSAFQTQETGQD